MMIRIMLFRRMVKSGLLVGKVLLEGGMVFLVVRLLVMVRMGMIMLKWLMSMVSVLFYV